MKYTFQVPNPHYYVEEHDRFITEILIRMSYEEVREIIYDGCVPQDAKEVKFSEYLNALGCISTPTGFLGYFGAKSYQQVLQLFICEALNEYAGTEFYLNIDVKPFNTTREEDYYCVSSQIEAIIKRQRKYQDAEG